MRLIDADNIQDELAALILYSAGTPEGECVEYAHNLIDAQPTIDAVPVVHAHWVSCEDEYDDEYKCSACGGPQFFEMTPQMEGWKYCPYCGARMDEEKENTHD